LVSQLENIGQPIETLVAALENIISQLEKHSQPL
jgi:hypothetical protein